MMRLHIRDVYKTLISLDSDKTSTDGKKIPLENGFKFQI